MKTIILCLAFLLGCSALVNAENKQPTGYLGKTIMFGVNAKVGHPYIYGFNMLYPDANVNLFVNITRTNRKSIEGSISYGFLSYNKPTDMVVDYYHYHNVTLDIGYKYHFLTGHYAPMGLYISYGLQLAGGVLSVNTPKTGFTEGHALSIMKFGLPGFRFSIGRHYVASDRLMINIGLDLCFNPTAFFLSKYDGYDRLKTPSYLITMRQETYNRIFTANGIQLNIGFGYLVK